MAVSRKAEAKPIEIEVESLRAGEATYCIVGLSPLIFNSVALKARQELLFPRGRLTQGQRATNLKHDPMAEFRSSVYRRPAHENGPTRLQFPSPALKGATATSALDMPSVAKSRIQRLTWVTGYRVDIWGIPQLMMSVVRSADIARTPDIRTRAILPEWATKITIRYIEPMLSATIVSTLLSAAGLIIGIGDFRQEKGKGNFGQFEIVNANDPRFLRIVASGGMQAQDEALASPEFYDADTEELYSWFEREFQRRGQQRRKKDADRAQA